MVTLFLALVVGWYLVIAGLLVLCQRRHLALVMADVMEHRGLFFILAIFTLIIGLLMVVSHNIWVMGWPVVITIFSWIVLIGALFRLFCLDAAMRVSKSFLEHPTRMIVAAIVSLIVGLFLLFHAYYVIFY